MNYDMNLTKKYFNLLKEGSKDIEVRLLDEKRSNLKEGDTITFNNANQLIKTKVIKIHSYNSVSDLVNATSLKRIGLDENKDIAIKQISDIYSKEKVSTHKILAIELKKD